MPFLEKKKKENKNLCHSLGYIFYKIAWALFTLSPACLQTLTTPTEFVDSCTCFGGYYSNEITTSDWLKRREDVRSILSCMILLSRLVSCR